MTSAPTPAEAAIATAYVKAVECYRDKRLAEAKLLCIEILRLDPTYGPAWDRLGHIAEQAGRLGEALAHYQQAIKLVPNPAEAHNNAGVVAQRMGDRVSALIHYQEAQSLGLASPLLHSNIGVCLRDEWKLSAAVAEFQHALDVDANLALVHANLGVTLSSQARLDLAVPHLRQAVKLDPKSEEWHSNLLCMQNYSAEVTARQAFDSACAFGMLEKELRPPRMAMPLAGPKPSRTLRVGFVSPDFRQHSVAFFIEPLVEQHDRQRFTFVGYSDVRRPDGVTARLQACFGEWRDVSALSHDDLLRTIEADNIDILIDLAGHTGGNRMPVFARRAAPVQISYCGFPSTTGLFTMDGRITDAWADPPGTTEALHTETLLRMPGGFLCYRPAPDAPLPRASTSLRSGGPITFGTFNHLPKLSPAILRTWGRLLHAVPGSRLVVKSISLGDAGTRIAFLQQMAAQNIPLDRAELRSRTASSSGHLEAYGDIDIALDTWPYNGTTTTCEALWMGVPVVTLAGNMHASRVGISLLHQVGLQDLATNTPDEYVACAAKLANNTPRRHILRNTLRARMRGSALMDAAGKTRAFEFVLREAWQNRVVTIPP